MLDTQEAWQIRNTAELLHSAVVVSEVLQRLAGEITTVLSDRHPIVLGVMGGAVVFTGQILPLLNFPLEFDYVHVSRYGAHTRGRQLDWKVEPQNNVRGRTVLILDDILDEGITLAAIRDKVHKAGAKAIYIAVFVNKKINRKRPIKADFVGLEVPDRFVFGFGMDVNGAWRNLPEIYAIK